MKKYILAIATLAAATAAAEAKCNTKALNGNWQFSAADGGNSSLVLFNDGIMTSGGMVVGTVTLNEKCKGAATIGGSVIKIRTERIEKSSAMKPNHMTFGFDDGAGGGFILIFQRY